MPNPTLQIALLRGVNVGGHNRLPMRDLVTIFEAAGCTDVRTYIQSGNVIYRADRALAAGLAERVRRAILDRFDIEIPVLTRSLAQWRKIIGGNPYLRAGIDPATLHVGCLAKPVGVRTLSALDPKRSTVDAFHATGTEIYLHCPGGLARSKLTNAYFDSKLGTVTTFRNWKTTLKILELAEA